MTVDLQESAVLLLLLLDNQVAMSEVAYNGTTGKADAGYSTGVDDLNIFYDASSPISPFP